MDTEAGARPDGQVGINCRPIQATMIQANGEWTVETWASKANVL